MCFRTVAKWTWGAWVKSVSGQSTELYNRCTQLITIWKTRYCTAAFLDIGKAFDKVWHTGLFLKLKQALPHPEYTLPRSYLTNRMFQVRHHEIYTMLHPIHAWVPKGSILWPILYTIFKADLPETEQTLTVTYADDIAILASHEDPIVATSNLQTHLHRLEHWLLKWCISAESKSTQHHLYLETRRLPQST